MGNRSPRWNPELTDEDRHDLRVYPEYLEWRKTIYERDDYTCQTCDEKGGDLTAHHIKAYHKHKKLRTKLSNGVTLCKNCHDSYHRRYGKKNANREDFIDWLIITATPTQHLVGKVLAKKEHDFIWPLGSTEDAPLPTRWEDPC